MKFKNVIIYTLTIVMTMSLMNIRSNASENDTMSIVQYLEIMTGDENGNMNLDQLVTRAEFTKMLVMTSSLKNSVNENSYTSVFTDVSYNHWATGYIKAALDAGWVTGYVDGSFKPNNPVKLEEAVTMSLRLIGYNQNTLSGVYPSAQLNQYEDLELNRDIAKSKGDLMTRYDCALLLKNLLETKTYTNTYYGENLGYKLDSDHLLDYDLLIEEELVGPLVVDHDAWYNELPFKTYDAFFYKDGSPVIRKEIYINDVYYYNPYTKQVWAYSDKILGIITDIGSDIEPQKTISVNNMTYIVSSKVGIQKIKNNSEFLIGDKVALLLGGDKSVVDVISLDEVDGFKQGLVTNTFVNSFKKADGTSQVEKMITIAEMDGKEHTYIYDEADNFTIGSLVNIVISVGKIKVDATILHNRSGLFSMTNMKLGAYAIADDIKIMDTNYEGNYVMISPERLDNVTLYSSNVYSVHFNEKNEIDTVFLRDATGDLLDYAYLTSISNNYSLIQDADGIFNEVLTSKTYKFYLNGRENSMTVEADKWDIYTGGVRVYYDSNKMISQLSNINELKVEAISQTKLQSNGKTYLLSDNIDAYYYNKGEYFKVEASALADIDKYKLTAYYDSVHQRGGMIRLLIAKDK